MRLDLPTLERPMNANSAFVSLGHCDIVAEEIVNSDFFISMSYIIVGDGFKKGNGRETCLKPPCAITANFCKVTKNNLFPPLISHKVGWKSVFLIIT